MPKQKFEHFEISTMPEFPVVTLTKVKDFVKLVELVKSMHVFVVSEIKNEIAETNFVLIHDRVIYLLNSHGFKTLDEYEEADENGFSEAADYNEAKHGGYHLYKDYAESKLLGGVVDRTLHMKAQKLGFIDHYEEFKTKLETNKKTIPEGINIADCDNPLKLCQFATTGGFKDYGDFAKAFFLGFTELVVYEDAKSKGFLYGKDYSQAVSMGFNNLKEYQEAVFLHIKTKLEYNAFDRMRRISKNIYGFDGVTLIDALKNYDNGKKLSIKKIRGLLNDEKNKIKFPGYEDNKKLPDWYICKLLTDKDIIHFFKNCEDLKDFGVFDEDGEFFEVSRMSDTTILVDASNVAFANINKGDNAKPAYTNIINLTAALTVLRYKEIIVIADASLKNRVMDGHQLESLKRRVKYLEAPAMTTADEFLIQYAKKSKCYIISNDTYRDWKMSDKWIAENIDHIRIPFLCNADGTFSLPVLEKIRD